MNLQHEQMYRELWGRVHELLGDGKWHNFEQAVAELGKLIPPGIAMRVSEQDRRRHTPGPRSQPRDVERQIQTGRRIIVRAMFKTARFETDRPGDPRRPVPQRRIRLRDPKRTLHGACPYDARGHNDARVQGPRGAIYWVCNLCGRVQRPSQNPGRRSR
jgi:hypothetical protein